MRTIKSMSFTKHADERIVRIHVGGGNAFRYLMCGMFFFQESLVVEQELLNDIEGIYYIYIDIFFIVYMCL